MKRFSPKSLTAQGSNRYVIRLEGTSGMVEFAFQMSDVPTRSIDSTDKNFQLESLEDPAAYLLTQCVLNFDEARQAGVLFGKRPNLEPMSLTLQYEANCESQYCIQLNDQGTAFDTTATIRYVDGTAHVSWDDTECIADFDRVGTMKINPPKPTGSC